MKKPVKWIIAIALLGAIGAAVVYNMANKETANISEKTPDLQYELEDLVARFMSDKEGFNQEHLDKIVRFKGTIVTLNALEEGGGSARIQSPDGMVDINVQLDDRINYQHIQEGDELDIKGVYVGHQEDILQEGYFEMVFQRGYFEKAY